MKIACTVHMDMKPKLCSQRFQQRTMRTSLAIIIATAITKCQQNKLCRHVTLFQL